MHQYRWCQQHMGMQTHCTQRAASPLLVLFLLTVFALHVCTSELFSSVSKLKTLPDMERQLLRQFDHVLMTLPDDVRTQELKRKLHTLERANAMFTKNSTFLENPLHAFRLVKRLVKQWPLVFRDSRNLTESTRGRFKEFLNATKDWITQHGGIWPSRVDLSGAATAIVRLHHLYDLDYTPLIRGHFLDTTSPPMTSFELNYVTRAAMTLGFVCDAKELFSALEALTAEKRVRGEGRGGTPYRVERLRDKLSDLMIGSVTECGHNSSITMPSFHSLSRAPLQRRKEAVRQLYHQLCRKSMNTSVVYGSGNHCFWQSTHIPYLRFKADVVNLDPFIVVFHDVIGDDEIREMKELSLGKISPSSLAFDQRTQEERLVRVSQNAWLFDSTPVMSRLSRRVQHVTGHSTRILDRDTHAEPYQVLNYGLGGVYGPHEDSVRIPRQRGRENTPQLQHAGDRTATWMYYLSDVSLGGATVFPVLGAGIRPQKGTAVLWYNLKRNGQADPRTVHAGCPVLHGDKWVANKWLREVGNVFSRPCLLDPDL